MRILIIFLLGFLFSTCKSTVEPQHILKLSEKQTLIFLDSVQASNTIIKDDVEGFFDKIQPLDMVLQLKKNYATETTRQEILNDYKTFIQQDVEDFSPAEIKLIEGVFKRVFLLCEEINSSIFPNQIKLIKTKGKHYGDGVFYTRENCIIIPANELQSFKALSFTEVMLHEVAHIYSRNNPEKRQQLYRLIGFKKIDCTTETLQFPGNLKKQVLLNPDGIDYTYAIRLKENADSSFLCLPIITANEEQYLQKKKAFFEYLDFKLYPVKKAENGEFEIFFSGYTKQGINPFFREDFKTQIKDNTTYIIHPDEILADNFKLLLLRNTATPKYDENRLSEEGIKLLDDIEKIISN